MSETLRLDKFLFQARFVKSRALASKLCEEGRVRVDGVPVAKAHYPVRPGDVLTFPQGRAIRVVKVLALPSRRGPAPEARALYEELFPDGAVTSACAPSGPMLTEPGARAETPREKRAAEG